jgi:hypothetical protein
MARLTMRKAYARLGVTTKNPRQPGWSNLTDDGRSVVCALWSDEFDADGRVYDLFMVPDEHGWTKKPQNRKRVEHLQRVGEGGLFDSIVVTRDPRQVARVVKHVEIGRRGRRARH